MFQDAWTVYIISQFIWITNMRQPLLFCSTFLNATQYINQ